MTTDNELQRLAMATNAIRPEWPIRSLVTLLTKHAARPYRDLAVALAWIATDARTKTPARLSEAGPWWTATSMTEGQGPTQSRMRCPDHPEQKAGSCAECFKAAVPRADLCPVPRRSKHLPTPCEMCGRAQRHDHRRYGCNPEHHEPMEES